MIESRINIAAARWESPVMAMTQAVLKPGRGATRLRDR